MLNNEWVLSLSELLKAVSGEVRGELPQISFSGISTDSRKATAGAVFFALKGENFDGHEFLEKAYQNGCTAAVVHQLPAHAPQGLLLIYVKDTLFALQQLASFWRHKMKAKIIGITGTNGKTTTKDFAATILSHQFKTFATKGNLNNFIGLPMSLLSLKPSIQVGIFEMGLSVPGEMEVLAKLADADIMTVTSLGRGHLEGMGTLENTAANKEQIYLCSRDNATRVFNLDNSFTKKMMTRAPKAATVYTYSSQEPTATVHFKETVSTLDFLEIHGTIAGEPGAAQIPIFGRHNISNLMCASALALAAGMLPIQIWKALPLCRGYWGRNQIVPLISGAKVLFDGYNANPESGAALLENISRIKVEGRLFAVFGDMLELGPAAADMHAEFGQKAARLSFEHVWFVGAFAQDFARGFNAEGATKKLTISNIYEESLAPKVRDMLEPGDIVLVKGSRGMALERVVQALQPTDFSITSKP